MLFCRKLFFLHLMVPNLSWYHFFPCKNLQQPDYSFYNLAADCNFGELKHKLIRDRIVVRIRDASLSERL